MNMDKRIIRTRAAIQQAYFQLLVEKEDNKISISELARAAGIDRKTFYLHYNSKEDIIREFCDAQIDEMTASLKAAGFFYHPFDSTVLFKALNDFFSSDEELARIVAVNEHFNFFWKRAEKLLKDTIIRFYRDKVIVSEKELMILASYVSSGIISAYRSNYFSDEPLSSEELARCIGGFSVDGIRDVIKQELRV